MYQNGTGLRPWSKSALDADQFFNISSAVVMILDDAE
jgi:hypothetical protein